MSKKAMFFTPNNGGQTNTYNTYIGGVGASDITSASELAAMMTIGVNSIQNFTINANNDIACLITSKYKFTDKFLGSSGSTFTSECTYFFDAEGYLEKMFVQQFYNVPNGILVFLSPTVEDLRNSAFDANFGLSPSNYIEYCVAPNAIFDSSTTDTKVFRSNSTSLNIYVNNFNETSNAGNPSTDLTVRSYASINYQTNINTPSKVTSITVDSSTATTIDISWTAPSSSNSIDGYFVFQDNSYVGFTSTESYTLTSSLSVSVNIITLDDQGNTSGISEEIYIDTEARNFIIEGVSSLIATKDDLLTEMFDDTSAYYQGIVENFTVDGDDISFNLTSSEEQHQIKWLNTGGFTTILKSYLDIGGNINKVNQGCFGGLSGLNYIHLPAMTYAQSGGGLGGFGFLSNLHYWHRFDSLQKVENSFLNQVPILEYLELPELTEIWVQNSSRYNFNNLSDLKICYMPKLSTISYPSGQTRSFVGTIPSSCVFYVPTALETSNGGNREQLVEYLEDTQGCTIVYIDNETPPNEVTDLAAVLIGSSSVVLSFSTPTSTNTVEFYEVWIDDGVTSWNKYFPKQHVSSSGDTLSGLTSSTNYDIKIVAVDEYYNKSGYSNTINITTTS
jgi:hypothetical protein